MKHHNLGVKEETKNKRMMIFSGSSSPELAKKIADNLQIKMGDVSRTHFKNGEIYVKFNESVRGADVFLIQTCSEPVNDHIMELLIMIDALKRFKSNIDTGIPQAIQQMAVTALHGPQKSVAEHNAAYQRRRDLICEVLTNIGLQVTVPKASLYIWARVPEGYNSVDFTNDMLDQVGVVVTPGVGYGRGGEGYVRLSLTISDASLVKGLSRLSGWRNTRRLVPKK